MDNDDLHKVQDSHGRRPERAAGDNASGDSASSKADLAKELDLVRGAAKRVKRGKRALDSIDNVLSKLVSDMGLDRRLKEHALLSLWPMMIGDVFAQKSRPLFIDFEGSIVIATKDASVAQELSLLKPEIIKKMRFAAQSMGLKVNAVRFDLKHYHGGTPALSEGTKVDVHKQVRRAEPTPEELDAVPLSESDLRELSALKASLPAQNPTDSDILKNLNLSAGESMCIKIPETAQVAQQDSGGTGARQADLNHRIFAMFEQELKLRQWRRREGFPICPKCEQPTQTLHGPDSFCSDCYFATLSHARDI